MRGYVDLCFMVDECAAQSRGDVLIVYNDDAICETKYWDVEYAIKAFENPMRPISSIVTGDFYRWAFPAISRQLYKKIGQFCPNNVSAVDRVWEAVSIAGGWSQDECQAKVIIRHEQEPMAPGTERGAWGEEVQKRWSELNTLWSATGAEVVKKIRA